MNNFKKIAIGVAATGILLVSALPAFAAAPVQPNCLGTDVSGFAQNLAPLGQNVVKLLSSGGFDNEILGHLQGPVHNPFSTCPNDGFPTPLH